MSKELQSVKLGDVPDEFNEDVLRIIGRILRDPAVLGIVYFRYNFVHMITVPSSMRRALTTKLPGLSPIIHRAVVKIDVLDELIAYRIVSETCEILVTGGKDIGAVVVQTRPSKKKRKILRFATNLK